MEHICQAFHNSSEFPVKKSMPVGRSGAKVGVEAHGGPLLEEDTCDNIAGVVFTSENAVLSLDLTG